MKKRIKIVLALALVLNLVTGLSISAASLIYIVDSGCNPCGPISAKITTIDSVTGIEAIINPGTGRYLTDIALSPDSQSLYAIGARSGRGVNKFLFRYDPMTGAELNKWNLGTGKFNNALVAESDDSLLLMAGNSWKIWRINLDASGDYQSTVELGNAGFGAAGDLAFGLDGTLYAAANPKRNQGPNTQLYSIGLGTGVSSTYIGDMGRRHF
ncbi:MAG: hypothetical protein GY869_03245, partial [Planctomycetes bacterium]|nr:hypothetical protein [Planctomycetota bacterium]